MTLVFPCSSPLRHTSALLHAECALSCLYVEMQQLNTTSEHNIQELHQQMANRKALQAKIEAENEKDKEKEKKGGEKKEVGHDWS